MAAEAGGHPGGLHRGPAGTEGRPVDVEGSVSTLAVSGLSELGDVGTRPFDPPRAEEPARYGTRNYSRGRRAGPRRSPASGSAEPGDGRTRPFDPLASGRARAVRHAEWRPRLEGSPSAVAVSGSAKRGDGRTRPFDRSASGGTSAQFREELRSMPDGIGAAFTTDPEEPKTRAGGPGGQRLLHSPAARSCGAGAAHARQRTEAPRWPGYPRSSRPRVS